MKNLFLTTLLILFTSQAYSSEKQRQSIDENTKNEILNVLQTNEGLFQLFFDRKLDNIKTIANKVSQAIDKISNKDIKKKLIFSQKKLSLLNPERSFKENSQDYHLISMALIHLITSYDTGDTYNVYYCPMVEKKWIQNSKKIKKVHNPYASNTMPHCGDAISHY